MKHLSCCALVALGLLLPRISPAATSLWNDTGGNWADAASWSPASVPVSAADLQLKFNVVAGYTSTNNLGPLTLNRLTVNSVSNGILTLASSVAANTLTFAGTNPTLDITGTVVFNSYLAGNGTITKTGTGNFIHDSVNTGFTGTLIVDAGKFTIRAETNTTANFNPVSVVVNNGAIFQFGNAGAGTPNLASNTYITANTGGLVSWQDGRTTGGLNLLGGSVELLYGTLTSNGSTAQSWTSGSITGNAYTGTAYAIAGSAAINKTTSGTVTLSGATSITSTGGLRIQDGTVVMSHALNLGTAPLTFGASGTTGTLEYQGATATRAGNIVRATGGGGVIRVTQASTLLTLSGAVSGSGTLNKTGPGTLNLTGANTATGLTQVSEGTLRVLPFNSTGAFSVGSGATLAVNVGSSSTELSVPTLTLADASSTLLLELNSATVPAQSLVTVRNANGLVITSGGTLQVTNSQPFANGLYTLLDYNGSTVIESGLTLQLPGRTLGSLIYDVANTRIQMDITGNDTIKWTGAKGSAWDVGSAANAGGTNNWQLVTGGTATNFIQTDTVRFDNSAANKDVQIAGTVRPFAVTVDAAADYTFTGAGKISGSTGLTKAGAGALVLATNNDYTGGTTVTGGTFQLGNGGTAGSITGSLSLSNSTLAFNRSDNITFDNPVTLAGSNIIRQNGAGTVTMNSGLAVGANTLTFDNDGPLTLGGTISSAAGGTLNFTGDGLLTLAGSITTAVGSTLNFDGDRTINQTGGITGAGIINKNGPGHLNLYGNSSFTGTININGGVLQLTDTDTGLVGDIDPVSIVVNNGGTFIFGPGPNPDLPGTTYVTVNTGGLYDLRTGESYGGIILNGGEYRTSGTNVGANTTGAPAAVGGIVFDLRSGIITTAFTGGGTGGQLGQGGGGVLAKTTPGTVTMGPGVIIHSGLSMQFREGTLAMQAGSIPATGTATSNPANPTATFDFGTATTEGILQIQGQGTGSSSRGVIVNAGGGRVDVVEAGTTLNFTGAVSGTGALMKTGAGTLNLTGTLGSSGMTTLAQGTLRIKSGTAAGGLTVATGTTLAVGSTASVVTLDVPTLSLAGGSTLQLELNSSTLPSAPLINVTGAGGLTLSGSGDVLLRLTNSQKFATGVYTLLDYAGPGITSGFVLEMEGRSTALLNYDVANTKLTANITLGEEVRWTGANGGTWDVGSAVNVGGSQNWITTTSLAATNFVQTDVVSFDDNAAVFDLNLPSVVRPNGITVNAATDYRFSGTGKISGTGGLSKAGTGTLVLTTDNDYTGGTTIGGGKIQLGNGGSTGSITGPVTLNGGGLVINRSTALTLTGTMAVSANTSAAADAPGAILVGGSGDVTLSGIISGAATRPLQMSGTGTLYLGGANTFTGTTIITSGTVSVATDKGLGAVTAGVNINGGTLQLTAGTLGSVVATTGRTITVGPLGATFDFRVAQSFSGNGLVGTGNVVKTGAGQWGVGSTASTFSGEVLIAEGSLQMTSATLNAAKNMTIASGAQFIINDNTAGSWTLATGGKFTLNGDGGGAGVLRQINTDAPTLDTVFTTTFSREIVLGSASTLINTEIGTGTISFTANVTGAGGLTKNGPGVIRLAGSEASACSSLCYQRGSGWIGFG